MKIRYVLADPNGNITILVHSYVPAADQPRIASFLMKKEPSAEQVGFLRRSVNTEISLKMAGGEFCGNAAMSAAVLYCAEKQLREAEVRMKISGTGETVYTKVRKENVDWWACVEMPRPCVLLSPEELPLPMVSFPGITHLIAETPMERREAEENLVRWSRTADTAAIGLLFFDRAQRTLKPLVYVPGVQTLIWENACASGTAAIGAYLAAKENGPIDLSLRQPNGGALFVSAETGKKPRISGSVKLIRAHSITIAH